LGGWLFSHAGVYPDWWPKRRRSTESRYRWLQNQWAEAFANIYKESENPIFAAGLVRGGIVPVGGPIWHDWNEEFEDALEVPQIVGHTRCAKQTQKGRSFCIDLAQAAYAVVDDGDVQLNILPKSWLGESMLDNGHQTDLLISDGPNFFRIQVKTVEAKGEDHKLENRWKDSHVDLVIAFARNSNWGYAMPAFSVNERRLNFDGHQRFEQNKNSFLKAFHKLEV
jgi:hypothetical protein